MAKAFYLHYRLFFNKSIQKLSGAKFIKEFLKEKDLKQQDVLFTIEPNTKEYELNRKYLNSLGISITAINQYVAPFYDKDDIRYEKLIQILENLEVKTKFNVLTYCKEIYNFLEVKK